uniref:F-box domain-containing protein n=1 Tax=Oryza glumipatula TaxID=40148 RepID=A0A0E0AJZ4_9ORYZ
MADPNGPRRLPTPFEPRPVDGLIGGDTADSDSGGTAIVGNMMTTGPGAALALAAAGTTTTASTSLAESSWFGGRYLFSVPNGQDIVNGLSGGYTANSSSGVMISTAIGNMMTTGSGAALAAATTTTSGIATTGMATTSLAESSGIGGRLVQDQEEAGSSGSYIVPFPNGHGVLDHDGLTGKATPYEPPPSWIPWIESPSLFGGWRFGSDAVAGGGDKDIVDLSPAGNAHDELPSDGLNLGSAGDAIINTTASSSRCGLVDVLNEDMVTEILLRLPPEDPALFARLQLVCKQWHAILGDPCFIRLLRKFHDPPPMLGYFINEDEPGKPMEIARFVHMTTTFRASPDIYDLASAVDSRHGLVLFYVSVCSDEEERFVVWDPMVEEEEEEEQWIDGFPFPVETQYWTVAVMCGLLECHNDHLHCHGGPFLVVAACTRTMDSYTSLRMYSSYTDGWSDEILHKEKDKIDTKACVLVGRKAFPPHRPRRQNTRV